jgi:hypothetical protein
MIFSECHESPADFEVPIQQGPRTPHHSWVDYDGEHHAGMGNGTHNLLIGGHESLPPSQGPWCLISIRVLCGIYIILQNIAHIQTKCGDFFLNMVSPTEHCYGLD